MDIMQIIGTIIGDYCFPIAISFILGYIVWDMNKKHLEESKGYIEAIDNNTKVMEKILDKLDDFLK